MRGLRFCSICNGPCDNTKIDLSRSSWPRHVCRGGCGCCQCSAEDPVTVACCFNAQSTLTKKERVCSMPRKSCANITVIWTQLRNSLWPVHQTAPRPRATRQVTNGAHTRWSEEEHVLQATRKGRRSRRTERVRQVLHLVDWGQLGQQLAHRCVCCVFCCLRGHAGAHS
jgi:hypothetical protein